MIDHTSSPETMVNTPAAAYMKKSYSPWIARPSLVTLAGAQPAGGSASADGASRRTTGRRAGLVGSGGAGRWAGSLSPFSRSCMAVRTLAHARHAGLRNSRPLNLLGLSRARGAAPGPCRLAGQLE